MKEFSQKWLNKKTRYFSQVLESEQSRKSKSSEESDNLFSLSNSDLTIVFKSIFYCKKKFFFFPRNSF